MSYVLQLQHAAQRCKDVIKMLKSQSLVLPYFYLCSRKRKKSITETRMSDMPIMMGLPRKGDFQERQVVRPYWGTVGYDVGARDSLPCSVRTVDYKRSLRRCNKKSTNICYIYCVNDRALYSIYILDSHEQTLNMITAYRGKRVSYININCCPWKVNRFWLYLKLKSLKKIMFEKEFASMSTISLIIRS